MPIVAPTLRPSIGLGRVFFHTVANISPAAVVALGLGQVVRYAGPAAPASMLLGALAGLAVAYSMAQLAARIPSSGGIYSYAVAAFNDTVGFLVGWLYALYSIGLACLSSLAFAVVLTNALSAYWHVTVPPVLVAVLVILSAAGLTYVGIKPSTSVTLVLGIAEVGLIFLVALTLIVHAGAANSIALFDPSRAGGSGQPAVKGLLLGVIFAMAAISGFESAGPLAEETTNARRTVPVAIFFAALLTGSFFVLCTYAAVVGWGTDRLPSYVGVLNPWRQMAAGIGSILGTLVVVAILDSVFAAEQAHFNSVSRVLFSLSRAGILPSALGSIHRRHRTPHLAILAVAAMAITAVAASVLLFNGAFAPLLFFFVLIGVPSVVLYAIACASCCVYYWRRTPSEFRWSKHVVPPLAGLAVLLPVLFVSFHGLEYPGSMAIPVLLVWMGVGACVYAWLKARHVDLHRDAALWSMPQARN